MRRRLLWFAFGFAGLIVLVTAGGGLYARRALRASLPQLDGTASVAGLTAEVSVDRDRLGVPTITAASRADAGRALGYVHAQDRFFQMDLQRRQAAGELSALVGVRALEADRAMRVHRFRHIAEEALKRTAPSYHLLLESYAAGVNAGLASLGASPVEYLVLGATPEPWRAEDTILTVLAMFNTLQGRQAAFEATFGTIANAVPPELYDFLTARGSEWDTPIVGEPLKRPAIPGADIFDLRRNTEARNRGSTQVTPIAKAIAIPCFSVSVLPCLSPEEESGLGSNNWAVAGAHTASGAALVANDMHLAINVPNIWYRASLVFPHPHVAGGTMRTTGVTLPGVPGIVVGSNGHVAWGFTNTGGDWSDLVIVEPDAHDPHQYLTPAGPQPIMRIRDPIDVHGAALEPFESEWTIWGPIVRTEPDGRRLAQHWVAHDIDRLAADVTAPEQAMTIEEALSIAGTLGIPAQNFVAADTTGRIGWTIAGPIPRREGFDGSRPVSWADGSRRWNGYLTAAQHPRVLDPASGRVWTANAPVVTGDTLALVGEGGYADGIRARIIRDRLMGIEKATPADMLSVQLDTSALFLERWRKILLEILSPEAIRADARRAEFRRLVETSWSGRAEPSSVGYLLVRTFRSALVRDVFAAITDAISRRDETFDYARTLRSEGPLWQLVSERPLHLLNPAYASWNAQFLAAVDASIAELTATGEPLATRSWSTYNRAIVTHPLGGAVPWAGRFVNMPADALPGDVYTPRAHSPRAGPSERMVVSPGREHEAIMHMPTGQSGHPLSPHYRDQHQAWVDGAPVPFLPGPAVSRLTLVPTP